MAFAAGWALRSAKDEGDPVAPKGAATLHEARGLAVPRLVSADPGPLRTPRPSPTPTSTGATAVAPAPAGVAPLAPPPAPAPQPSATPGGEERFDSTGDEGSGYFDSER
jgi:DNA polymerase-3 subunit gamma/tau